MEKLNVAIIGAGLWGRNHATVFSTLPQTHIRAICDVDRGRAEATAKEFKADQACTTIDEVLALSDVDAVSVATPDATHTKLILAALEAGKHVLSEKPLATTVEEAEAVAAAAEAAPGRLMVDFHNRVNPAFVGAKNAIDEGRIGQPIHITGRLSDTVFVPFEMLSWAAQSSALWFLGSHLVDILRFLTGQEVTRVYAVKHHGFLAGKGVDTDDVHLSTLEFSGGTIAQIENSWVHPADGPSVYDLKCEIFGTAGALQIDVSHNGGLRFLTGKGMSYGDLVGVTPTGVGRVGGFVMEAIARFVDAVMHDAPLLADANDGLRVTRVLAAIEQSATSGQPVDLAS